jgi:hypothetical protein
VVRLLLDAGAVEDRALYVAAGTTWLRWCKIGRLWYNLHSIAKIDLVAFLIGRGLDVNFKIMGKVGRGQIGKSCENSG